MHQLHEVHAKLPVKAITAVDKKPVIDYGKCIRCYCCHEMCDDHAIALERT